MCVVIYKRGGNDEAWASACTPSHDGRLPVERSCQWKKYECMRKHKRGRDGETGADA